MYIRIYVNICKYVYNVYIYKYYKYIYKYIYINMYIIIIDKLRTVQYH